MITPDNPTKKDGAFKYKIGDWVWQYTKDDDYDRAQIWERKVISGMNYYTTSLYSKWEHEDFLL